MSNAESLKRAFVLQAGWGEAVGSPFTGALMRAAARDFEDGGPTRDIVGDWSGDPIADALPTRFGGALHAAVVLGKDPALAAEYPDMRSDWDMQRVWPLARAFLTRERAWVRDFLRSPPQTNETRRTIALLPGFLAMARFGPLHLLELGASAGLNLMWDRYRYATASWRWGSGEGPLIDTQWYGAPPADLDVEVNVASRAACDRNPLDVRNADHVLRLRAFVWADQPERRERLEKAMALAREADIRVDRDEAGVWLAEKLARPLPRGVTIVYHSVVQQYFNAETNRAVDEAIAKAAAGADEQHRLARLRFEAIPVLGVEGPVELMGVELQYWPDGERRLLSRTDGHATRVAALDQAEAGAANLK
ncbi:MAG TPA: DUF2332 domain-containing protein [Caulobacterales bacterium]|nr:DUF2332 domain-containing protein [Caulobacterales bacterium]